MKPTQPKPPTTVVLFGISGYAERYLEAIQAGTTGIAARIVAVVDPFASKARHWDWVQSEKIPCYNSLSEMSEDQVSADLAVISSPIAFHADQACAALDRGMHVLCEKPIAGCYEDARRMEAAALRSGKTLEIGYQWSFSEAIQDLKQDILSGAMGAPIQAASLVLWPRTSAYFGRNAWAGKCYDENKNPVFDSPANNAAAHFLHNMLFLLGPVIDQSARPQSIEGECYRVNPIENFDSVCCRILTDDEVEILFYATHCARQNETPVFRIKFEKAIVEYSASDGIVARFEDGEVRKYGNPNGEPMRKLRGNLARCSDPEGHPVVCGPAAAMAHTRCIEGLQAMSVAAIPPKYISEARIDEDERLLYVESIEAAFHEAYAAGRLFSEMSVPWSVRKAETVHLDAF